MDQQEDDSLESESPPKLPCTPTTPSSTPPSPFPPLHPILLLTPSSNPHLLFKPRTPTRTLTLTPSSSTFSSMASPPPPPPTDNWDHASSDCDGGLDDCAIFPPSLHEGLHDRTNPNFKHSEEMGLVGGEEETDRLGLKRRFWDLWELGVRMAGSRLRICGASGVVRVGPTAWSLVAGVVLLASVVYVRRRDRRERDLLFLLIQEKDQRISQLLHQIAFMNDMRKS